MKTWNVQYSDGMGGAGNLVIEATDKDAAISLASQKISSIVGPRQYSYSVYDEEGKQVGGGGGSFGGSVNESIGGNR